MYTYNHIMCMHIIIYIETNYLFSQPASQPTNQPASQPANQPNPTRHHPPSPQRHMVRGSVSYLAKWPIIGPRHAPPPRFKSIVFYRCVFTSIGDGKYRRKVIFCRQKCNSIAEGPRGQNSTPYFTKVIYLLYCAVENHTFYR